MLYLISIQNRLNFDMLCFLWHRNEASVTHFHEGLHQVYLVCLFLLWQKLQDAHHQEHPQLRNVNLQIYWHRIKLQTGTLEKNTHTKRRETSWKIHKIHGFCKHLHQTYLTYLATAWHLPDPFCSRWKTWSRSRNSGQLGKSKDSTSWNSSSGKRWSGGLLDKHMSNFYLIHE